MIRALLLVAALEAGTLQDERPPAPLLAALEEERVARLALEAARSKEFYLRVDVSGSTLSLNLGGITLATYRLESVELGLPLAVTEPSGDELTPLFTCEPAVVDAPREIQPGPPPSPGEQAQPPEEDAKPTRLHLDCEPPLSVHLVSGGAGIRERMRLPGDRDRDLRVRVVLSEEDAPKLLSSVGTKTLLLFSLAPAKTEPGGGPSPR